MQVFVVMSMPLFESLYHLVITRVLRIYRITEAVDIWYKAKFTTSLSAFSS
ncbi:hypothetical protein LguiA_001174 [Lonicera macranthoides]